MLLHFIVVLDRWFWYTPLSLSLSLYVYSGRYAISSKTHVHKDENPSEQKAAGRLRENKVDLSRIKLPILWPRFSTSYIISSRAEEVLARSKAITSSQDFESLSSLLKYLIHHGATSRTSKKAAMLLSSLLSDNIIVHRRTNIVHR